MWGYKHFASNEAMNFAEVRLSSALLMIRVLTVLALIFNAVSVTAQHQKFEVRTFDRARVLKAAKEYLSEQPITITASSSPRSAGGLHDFFSEADYWWPDPKDPNGPYVQRDGMSNPNNFVDHRRYLMRLSVQVPALVAAWKLTKDIRYAQHAASHLRAWFLDERTRMNPNLQFAQAIHGRMTGRGTGIIDTIHLVEVARAIEVMETSNALSADELKGIKQWFADYLQWMTTHQNGIDEREAKNNHGTCWVMQVAEFARLTGNQQLLAFCRDRFKTVLLPNQMAADGSFPEELRRTKPYGYSLFNLEALAGIAQLLSTPGHDLWNFTLPDGRGLRRAMQFMVPYVRDKKSWPRPPDVMYEREWPMRQASLLFAGLAFAEPGYLELWRKLPPDSGVDEVVRNFFIRQPALWVGDANASTPAAARARETVVVVSPRRKVEIVVEAMGGGLTYRVTLAGQPVVEPSPLGILMDGVDLGRGARVGRVDRYSTNERYPWRGVHSEAVDRSRGARVHLTHAKAP